MKTIVGIVFLVIGLFGLLYMSIRETDRKTHWKIMVAASLGAFVLGGAVILLC